ncbi:ABC transporter ATP-binding protein uup, partial [Haemophilus influenzae]
TCTGRSMDSPRYQGSPYKK